MSTSPYSQRRSASVVIVQVSVNSNMTISAVAISFLIYAVSTVTAVQVKRSWEINNWNDNCELPPCPKHANYEVTGVKEGWHGEKWPTEVVFTCWPGYTLVGSRAIECYGGRWSDHTPQCIDYRTSGTQAQEYGYESRRIHHEGVSPVFPQQYRQQQFVSHQQQFVPNTQHSVSYPQQFVPQLQHSESYPQRFVPRPQLPLPQPQPPVSQPQQSVSQPLPFVSQPQQPVSQPQQPVSQPQQPVSQPQPFISQPQQPVSQPQPFISQPQQPVSQLQPFISQPQHPVSQPQPFLSQPQFGMNFCSCDKPQQQQPVRQPQTLKSRGDQPKMTSPATGGCILPPYPENGTYKLTTVMNPVFSNNQQTANLTYVCNQGFIREGVSSIFCLQGRWSENFPFCTASPMEFGPAPAVDTPTLDNDTPSPPGDISFPTMEPIGEGQVGITAVGGTSAQRSELPWHVGVYVKDDNSVTQICGGSIVSRRLVVSAAHCFWDDLEKLRPASQFAIGAGKLYRSWDDRRDMTNAQKVDVSDIKIPPRYQHVTASFQEDIALVTVATDFDFNSFVMPVILDFNTDLDSKHLQEGNLGTVGGWGLITEDGAEASVLQVVRLPYIGIEKCIAENEPGFLKYITGDKICAGYKNGTAVCMGDSGGGLIYTENENGNQRFYLRGIASTAPTSENACNIYDWTTFTHILRHDHFLQPLLMS